MKKLHYDRERVMQARDLRRRWYDGEKTERTPFVFSVRQENIKAMYAPGNPYTYREMCEDGQKAVDGLIFAMQYQFDTFPDCDYLPVMLPYYLGEGILATMYGAEQYLVDEYPPFTKGRVFTDIADAMKISNDFTIEETTWGAILKEHMERFVDATGGEIPIGMADYQSPYGSATKLIPNEELMIAMYDHPELMHCFMETMVEGIIKLINAMERWVGRDLIAHNVQNPIPGACGLVLWDDYISVITPDLHKEFCVPYNRKLYERYGYGHLHTCGPYFPAYIDACLACSPRSMDIGIMRGMGKTKEDLMKFLSITKEKNIRLFGSLDMNDQSVFDEKWTKPDISMWEAFISGGYMPSAGGTYEEGVIFKQLIRSIDEHNR